MLLSYRENENSLTEIKSRLKNIIKVYAKVTVPLLLTKSVYDKEAQEIDGQCHQSLEKK